jgi:hypothetical protein
MPVRRPEVTMKRRDFFASLAAAGVAAPAMAAQHDHSPLNGPFANATVSFGQWLTGQDRQVVNPPPPTANGHLLLPHTAFVKAGGAVNFIIAGLHQVVVYGPGKRPGDVNLDPTTFIPNPLPSPPAPPFPPLINDAENRVYRGPDPRLLFPNLDRVEVVKFPNPGLHLVICGVVPHFQNDNMFGWVWVLR